MDLERTNLLKRFQRSANRQHCPACGALMVMLHSGRENGALFGWYACTRNGCSGQRLKKIINILRSNIEKVI